jgi:hypothetical protein
MTSRALYIGSVWAAVLVVSLAVEAQANSGTPSEELRYAPYMSHVDFTCPKGTQRLFTHRGEQQEELCVTPTGRKAGYYIRWNSEGNRWKQLGHFVGGRRHGVWLDFDAQGVARKKIVYQKGRRIKNVTLGVNNSSKLKHWKR